MMHLISWADFLYGILTIAVIYYVAVITVCYRRELVNVLSGKKPGLKIPPSAVSNMQQQNNNSEDARLFAAVHDLMEDLKLFWAHVKTTPFTKPALLQALRAIIIKYPLLQHTAFQIAINNQVVLDAEECCSMTLSDTELNNLWIG
jgi:hypothetical protein